MATSIIIDNNSDGFNFSGTQFSPINSDIAYNHTFRYTFLPSNFDFSFEGTTAAFIGLNGGIYRQFFQTPTLSDGSHTITVNCSNWTYIDFAVVTQPVGNQTRLAGRDIIVDNDSPSILYSGHWNQSTNFGSLGYPSPYGNSTHRSSTTGDSFAFQFTGTSVSVYGIFSWLDLGTLVATYTIDGATVVPRTYNITSLDRAQSNGGEIANFLHYSSDSFSPGDHTLIVNITIANNLTFVLDYITYKPSFETLSVINTTGLSTTVMSSPSLGNPTSPPAQVQSSGPLRPAAIVGGIIGLLTIGILVAILGRFFFLRRKAKQTRDILMYENDASQVLPQSYPSRQLVKYVRESNSAEQASDSHLPGPVSMDPPPNIDDTGDLADPPPYDDLTSIRPVSQHIIAI